jgi:hypothetical protein
VSDPAELGGALAGLGIRCGRPVLAVVGGASGLGQQDLAAVTGLLRYLVPALERWDAAVVDGGTDSGVMRALGEVREGAAASFPLIGVAAEGTVVRPDEAGSGAGVELEPRHTHVVLVPGDEWGDEASWLAAVATAVAGGSPSATLVLNGGELTFVDAEHSLAVDRPLLVVSGSGRTADAIAAAGSGGSADTAGPADERATRIAASPRTQVVSLDDPAGTLEALRVSLGGSS